MDTNYEGAPQFVGFRALHPQEKTRKGDVLRCDGSIPVVGINAVKESSSEKGYWHFAKAWRYSGYWPYRPDGYSAMSGYMNQQFSQPLPLP